MVCFHCGLHYASDDALLLSHQGQSLCWLVALGNWGYAFINI